MANSAFILNGTYYDFSDVSAVYLYEKRVVVNGYGKDLGPDYSLAQFLTEYNEWLKEENNKLNLPDGWYSAKNLNMDTNVYSVYIKDNKQYSPWLGKAWKESVFTIKNNDQYWSDYKPLNWGKLNNWREADIFVTGLNERKPSYWNVT